MKHLSWLITIGLAATASDIFTFDTAPFGKTPPGWTVTQPQAGATPSWEIRKDSSAPSQPYVLAHVSRDPAAGRFLLAIVDKYSFRDGEISVRFKPVAGKEERMAGLVWRYRGPNDYYVVGANALDNDVLVYRVENGKVIPLAPKGQPANTYAVKHKVMPNTWSTLKIQFRGNQFAVYYDHRRILRVEDSTFGGPGKVGLWTKPDSVAYFDDFRVVQRN